MKKYFSEFLGTACLVFFGCAAASIAGAYVGTLGIAVAFGLSFIISNSIIGKISGCHINPAVSLAMFLNHKLSLKDLVGYIIAQILGALFGSFLLTCVITSANIGSINEVGLGANGFGKASSVGLSMTGALIVEIILSFFFVLTVLKVSEDKKNNNSAFIIAFALTLVHIVGIPLTGTSVNPARSLAPALLLKGEALKQVWVFILAPLIGSVLATLANRFLLSTKD